ncbi:MAG: PD-(D/E)XK motif protein [Gammaproteobacteria bacterium]|nr:PD-(D/E)XK motif protein [Gammaproteobacteria bacterium]
MPSLSLARMVDPWADISKPGHPGLSSGRRADADHPLDFFYGKDFHGNHVFWLEGGTAYKSIPRLPVLGDIDTMLIETGINRCRLSLTLRSDEQKDVFRVLCSNLMQATENLEQGENGTGILIVANRLLRWHDLLRRRRDGTLSQQQIIGLIGELLFLRDRVLGRLPPLVAAKAWRGPYRDEQDFVIGNKVIEIKTQVATADKRVRISSEDQLDSGQHRLFLVHQTLGTSEHANDSARTLNRIVEEVLDILDKQHAGAADTCRVALIEAGWRSRPEYDDTAWLYVGSSYFEVKDGFPRITPSLLPLGVERVRYDVQINACDDFILEEMDAMEMMFNDYK